MVLPPRHVIGTPQKFKNKPRPFVFRYPRLIEYRYMALIKRIANTLLADFKKDLIPMLPDLADYYAVFMDDTQSVRPRLDDFNDDLDRLLNGILFRFGNRVSDATPDINAAGKAVDQDNAKQVALNVKKALGMDILQGNVELTNAIDTWTSSNVDLITRMGTDSTGRVKNIVLDGFRSGLRPESIAKGITDSFKSASDRQTMQATGLSVEDRAAFLARDQIGKLNGQVSKQRQQKLGLSRYRWRTSLDERVRETHRKLEGKIFYWNEKDGPVAPEGPPGMPINCRCYAEPYVEDLLTPDDMGD